MTPRLLTADGDGATSAGAGQVSAQAAEAYAEGLTREIIETFSNSGPAVVATSSDDTANTTNYEELDQDEHEEKEDGKETELLISIETPAKPTPEKPTEAEGEGKGPQLTSEAEPEPEAVKEEEEQQEQVKPAKIMEFTKNFSEDSLMGQTDGNGGQPSHTTNADLADFELPPYSGSSSGSSGNNDPPATTTVASSRHQASPARRGSNSDTTTTKAQSTSSSQVGSSSPPSLTALQYLLKANYSRVSHVFLWRKPIESGICFASGVSLIIALTFFSIISVVAYSTLGLIVASGLIRLYKTVMKTLNRSTDTPVDHIWNKVLALNVTMSHERMHELVDSSLGNFNASLVYFKQVLLVEDKMATIKFGVFVYFLTYIGAWFNGMTLIALGFLGLFTAPILYEKNSTKIDEYFNIATGHLCSATSMITNKVGSLVSSSSSPTAGPADKKQA